MFHLTASYIFLEFCHHVSDEQSIRKRQPGMPRRLVTMIGKTGSMIEIRPSRVAAAFPCMVGMFSDCF